MTTYLACLSSIAVGYYAYMRATAAPRHAIDYHYHLFGLLLPRGLA